VIDGDYQESNLFFVDGKVSAIIDWDKTCVAAHTWEILRVCGYVFNLDAARCQLFLRAYRAVQPISTNDLAVTAQAYGWIQNQNLWAYRSFYLANNQRVRHLLQPHFTSFETRWPDVMSVLVE
jgi:Ser/Thr protein kinase RdoA (MazF antagonist)